MSKACKMRSTTRTRSTGPTSPKHSARDSPALRTGYGAQGSDPAIPGQSARGISAVVFNDARDKRGNYYAEFVHLKGDEPEQAAKDAFEIFAEEMEIVSQEMIASLTRDLDGS